MKILTIAWKDALLRFSDRAELLYFLILPVIFTYLLSGGAAKNTTATRIPLLVVDQDRSSLSSGLVTALSQPGAVEASPATQEEAEAQFAARRVDAYVIIPAGFEAALLAGNESPLQFQRTPNNTDGDAAERVLDTAVGSVNRAVTVARLSLAEAESLRPFASAGERQAYLAESLSAAQKAFSAAPARVEMTRPAEAELQGGYDPASQASAGQTITWVFVPLLGTCVLFTFERRKRTLARLLTTPTPKPVLLLGTIVSQLAIAMVQVGILFGVGAYLLHVNWGKNPLAAMLLMLVFGLAAVALGTLLGTLIKTEKQGNNLSLMLGMVMALLGGCWWPMEMFPPAMQTAVKLLPTTWAMQGLIDLTQRGQGLVQILPSMAALLGFALLFFTLGILRFRYE